MKYLSRYTFATHLFFENAEKKEIKGINFPEKKNARKKSFSLRIMKHGNIPYRKKKLFLTIFADFVISPLLVFSSSRSEMEAKMVNGGRKRKSLLTHFPRHKQMIQAWNCQKNYYDRKKWISGFFSHREQYAIKYTWHDEPPNLFSMFPVSLQSHSSFSSCSSNFLFATRARKKRKQFWKGTRKN